MNNYQSQGLYKLQCGLGSAGIARGGCNGAFNLLLSILDPTGSLYDDIPMDGPGEMVGSPFLCAIIAASCMLDRVFTIWYYIARAALCANVTENRDAGVADCHQYQLPTRAAFGLHSVDSASTGFAPAR